MGDFGTEKRVPVIAAHVEGDGINSIVRLPRVAKHTILELLEAAGSACVACHYGRGVIVQVRGISCTAALQGS
jgi:hypothetical protein